MESARSLAKKALGSVCAVAEEDQTATIREKEYATVTVVSGVYTAYADNKPIQRRDNVDVNLYAVEVSRLDELTASAEAALAMAGFIPQDLPADVGSDQNHQRFGVVQEFALYRAVDYGS